MKVIDLLNKIANGEEVPKKVRVLDMSILPEYQIIIWNENLGLYEYCDGCEFDRILDKHHLEKYVKIIEDTPEENKEINNLQKRIDKAIRYIEPKMICEYIHTDYINNMIKLLKGEENE